MAKSTIWFYSYFRANFEDMNDVFIQTIKYDIWYNNFGMYLLSIFSIYLYVFKQKLVFFSTIEVSVSTPFKGTCWGRAESRMSKNWQTSSIVWEFFLAIFLPHIALRLIRQLRLQEEVKKLILVQSPEDILFPLPTSPPLLYFCAQRQARKAHILTYTQASSIW